MARTVKSENERMNNMKKKEVTRSMKRKALAGLGKLKEEIGSCLLLNDVAAG